MANKQFKGILQYRSTDTFRKQAGYIYFVRVFENGQDTGNAEVYFGTRKYGEVSATKLASLETAVSGNTTSINEIKQILGEWKTNLGTVASAVVTVSGATETNATEIEGLKTTVGNADSGLVKDVADLKGTMEALPETFVTDVKVGETSLVADGVANLSNFVQKDGDKVLSSNDYTTAEKEKLAGIAEGAEVNYVKSVGDNLNVDGEGKLTVTIPEVEVPFQSVAADDKVLTLGEGGVLKSDLTFTKETIEGAEYLVVKGKNGVEIGKVATAEFTVDGVLDTVAFSDVEGEENILVLTFNTEAGKQPIKVDFGKYVDAYSAGSGLTLSDKAFAVNFDIVAKKEDLTAHTGNTEIHVTADEKAKWNEVDDKLDTSAFNEYTATTNGTLTGLRSDIDAITSGAVQEVVSSGKTVKVTTTEDDKGVNVEVNAMAVETAQASGYIALEHGADGALYGVLYYGGDDAE